MAETVEEGDLVYVEYEGWVENPGGGPELFDTTSGELAQEHEIYDEKRVYGPMAVIVGTGRLMEGLDDGLVGASVGEATEIVIPPEKGAGQRDPSLVQLYPLREFHRQEIDPHPGMEVTLQNRTGTVTAVTAGRVRVDFNNPLAGKTLRYHLTVTERVEETEAKIRAILEMDYGNADEFQVEVEDGAAEIALPDACKYDDKWFVNKYRVVSDLRDHANLETVRFVETYAAPKAEEDEDEEGETASAGDEEE